MDINSKSIKKNKQGDEWQHIEDGSLERVVPIRFVLFSVSANIIIENENGKKRTYFVELGHSLPKRCKLGSNNSP